MKTIKCFFDIDGTLKYDVIGSEVVPRDEVRGMLVVMSGMVDVEVSLWSSRGADYAKEIGTRVGIAHRCIGFFDKTSEVVAEQNPNITVDDEDISELCPNAANIVVPDPNHMDTPAESQARTYNDGVRDVLMSIAAHGKLSEFSQEFFDEFKEG